MLYCKGSILKGVADVAKNSLFRNSLGGYNKNDVNRYIDELGIRFSDRNDELEGEIKQLKKELEALPGLISEKEKADREISDLRAQKENLTELLEEKTKECENLLLETAKAKEELLINIKETEEMRNQLEKDKSDFEERAEEMLLQIQAQAKEVIDKANETAELIIQNAKKKASKTSHEAASADTPARKKDGLSDIFESHKSKMDSFFSAITKTFMGEGK